MHKLIATIRATNPGLLAIYALLSLMAIIMVASVGAKAEGLPKKKAPSKAPAASEDVIPLPKAAKSWTGCGVGVHASWVSEIASGGGGVEGSTLGASGICLAQLQQFVVGVEGSYDHYFGDLKGANYNLAVTGIAGIAMGNVLPYAHVSPWSRIDTGNVDGYKFGAGIMFRPADSKLVWDARFSRGVYDDVGLDANEVRFGVKYLFHVGK